MQALWGNVVRQAIELKILDKLVFSKIRERFGGRLEGVLDTDRDARPAGRLHRLGVDDLGSEVRHLGRLLVHRSQLRGPRD